MVGTGGSRERTVLGGGCEESLERTVQRKGREELSNHNRAERQLCHDRDDTPRANKSRKIVFAAIALMDTMCKAIS